MLDRKGGIERLKLPAKAYAFPRVSPDGKRVAVSTDDSKEINVWIIDLAGATAPRQLTLGGANRYPVWSADGERVAFQSDRDGDLGIFWQKVDGTGPVERLTKPEQGIAHIPDSWNPDNKRFSYTAVKGSEAAVWMFSVQDKKRDGLCGEGRIVHRQVRVFPQWTVACLSVHRNGDESDLRAAVSEHERQISDCSRRPSLLVARRTRTYLQSRGWANWDCEYHNTADSLLRGTRAATGRNLRPSE